MGKLKTKVIVLGLTHMAEDYRKLVFAPIDKDDNIIQGVSPFSIIAKGEKNDKNNFAEGEIYNLSITSDDEEAPAPATAKKTTGKGKDTPPATPAPTTPATEEVKAESDASNGEGQDPPANTGNGEGQ